MVILIMDATEFGLRGYKEVKANYNSIEDAERQAEDYIKHNTKKPLRLEDETGKILKEFK
jgi:hypothetical protein